MADSDEMRAPAEGLIAAQPGSGMHFEANKQDDVPQVRVRKTADGHVLTPPQVAALEAIEGRISWPSMHWGVERVSVDAWPHLARVAADAAVEAALPKKTLRELESTSDPEWAACSDHPGKENHCASSHCGSCWLCDQESVTQQVVDAYRAGVQSGVRRAQQHAPICVTIEQVETMAREYAASELNEQWDHMAETAKLHCRTQVCFYLRAADIPVERGGL